MRSRINILVIFVALLIASSPARSQCPPVFVFTGEGAEDQFSWSVDIAEDLDGDGYDDIILGAVLNDSGGVDAGRVYVFSGLTGDTMYVLTGASAGDQFGIWVGGLGDINADGFGDFAVGAPLHDTAGTVYVFSGQDIEDTLYTFAGAAPGDRVGRVAAAAGDFNNDGINDILVGAREGKAYVFSGANGDTLLVATGETSGDLFGAYAAGAGDVNSDGYDDVIIGARSLDALGDPGHAFVYSGHTGLLLYRFTGEAPVDRFGMDVEGAGDVNNDGIADMIVGAPRNDAGGDKAGRAYVFFGDTTSVFQDVLAADADIILTGFSAGERFGRAVSGVSDLNQDGYGDIVVGAQWVQSSDSSGHVFIFSGQDLSLMQSYAGENGGDQYGKHVSTSGDLNNDGAPDLLIGAATHNVGAGKAYAYFLGDSDCDSVLDISDNCPDSDNPLQEDGDADGYGDDCDNCPAYATPGNVAIITGDVNVDGNLTSADIIGLVNFVFKGDDPPAPIAEAGDTDCSGAVTSADIIQMVNHVFKGGPAPCDVCAL